MPILPFIYDNDDNLEAVVKATAENGGKFVLAGGLTLASSQKEWYYSVLEKRFPGLIPKYEKLYAGNYGPDCRYIGEIGKKVASLCQKFGIKDRMPRHIPKGKLAINKQISERLHNKAYRLELDCAQKIQDMGIQKGSLDNRRVTGKHIRHIRPEWKTRPRRHREHREKPIQRN